MSTVELNADEIFRKDLLHLGNEAKRRLIELLASSLTFSDSHDALAKNRKKGLWDKANGAWCNDGVSADEEIELLRNARVQGKTRKLAEL